MKTIVAAIVAFVFAGAVAAQVPVRKLPACKQSGQTVTLSLNTGTAGALPPPATVDPFWRLSSGAPLYSTSVVGPNLWLPNTAASRWVQPANNGGNPAPTPLGTFIYETRFVTPVDPYLYSSITISGAFAADDGAVVKLNGIPLANCTPGSTPTTWCFNKWTPIPAGVGWTYFNRSSGFLNTLTIEVKNTLAGSPSGALMRANLVAVCSKCTSPVPPVNPPCGGNPSTC